jgi:hypothetical protein
MVSWDQHRVDAHQAKFTPAHRQPDDVQGVKMEGDLHDKIEEELKRRRWYYVHSRMDKPTTTEVGVTDFIIAIPENDKRRPRTLWLEAKRHGAKLTKEQNIVRHILVAAGHWHEVVYSMKQFLALPFELGPQANCKSCGKKCYQPICHECQVEINKSSK